jgi:predicted phosphodiesterase
MSSTVTTRVLILSDTHGDQLLRPIDTKVDIVIHCGDLTEESKLEEYRTAVKMLKEIDAPLKLVIAGNHDFSLDQDVFQTHLADLRQRINDNQLVKDTYGKVGEAKAVLEASDAKQNGIVLLNEGICQPIHGI